MIDPAILRALAAAGATAEMIVAAVEADHAKETAKAAERRAKAAQRKRESRARSRDVTSGHAMSHGQGVTAADPSPPSSSPSNGSPTPLPITTPSAPPTPSSSLRSESLIERWPKDFREQFWAAYPRKVGKKAALRKLELIGKSGEIAFDALIAAARKASEGIDDPKFIPHPMTWLHQGRYLDTAPPAGSATATGPPPGLTAQQQRDWERGWRPGMPSSEEMNRRINGKAGTTGRSVEAHEQGELLAAGAGDDEATRLRQGDRH